MEQERKIDLNSLLFTMAAAAFAAAAYSLPSLTDALVYERQAVLNGEIWRIFTAPFVHFSPGHFLWDTVVFTAAGIAVSYEGFPLFKTVCFLAASIPGLIYVLFVPELEYYGGLSGMATGAVIYYCLCTVFMTRRKKTVWVLILALTIIKIAIEAGLDNPIFADANAAEFRVLSSAHIAGYGAALAVFLPSMFRKKLKVNGVK